MDGGGLKSRRNEDSEMDSEIYLYKPRHGVVFPASYMRHANVMLSAD